MSSKELRRLRKAAGLTQEELAKRAGYSTQTIHRYETGVHEIPRDKAIVLQVLLRKH